MYVKRYDVSYLPLKDYNVTDFYHSVNVSVNFYVNTRHRGVPPFVRSKNSGRTSARIRRTTRELLRKKACLFVRSSSCSGGQRANPACCLRPPPAMLVRARDAVACVLSPRLLLYPHGRIRTEEPSIRPSSD
jgi:hypothetical protein